MPTNAICMLATETGSLIDSTVLSNFKTLIDWVVTLFTVEPINYFLIAGLCGIAFGLFRKAKHTAR